MPHPTSDVLMQLEHVSRVYRLGQRTVTALDGIDLEIRRGEFVTVIGPSGSGKSTLLNLMAGIDRPTSGRVIVDGVVLNALSEDELARWRGEHVGIVFQFFQLLPTLTALENVMLPMELRGTYRGQRRRRALQLLEEVGLADVADHLPSELSGGEQQRVAIARALANDPPILLADEPTGNLDTETGQRIVALLAQIHAQGKTVVLVTHERYLSTVATRVIEMKDGRIVADRTPAEIRILSPP